MTNHSLVRIGGALFIVLFAAAAHAQDNLDTLCGSSEGARFWSVSAGGAVRQWTLIGNTITGGQQILQGPGGTTALAYCDAQAPSTFHAGAGTGMLYAYSGGTWVSSSTVGQVTNLGGSGSHLYYTDGWGQLFHSDGSNASMIVDPAPLAFACADVAVSPDGLAYLLVGPDYQTTSSVRAYDATGAVIADYPLAFDSFNTYGTFWMNGRMYIASGTLNSSHPNMLFPISFSLGTATVEDGIAFPADGLMDLASCSPSVAHGVSEREPAGERLVVFPNPAFDDVSVRCGERNIRTVRILDVAGRTVIHASLAGDGHLSVRSLSAGPYLLQAITDEGVTSVHFTKL